MCRLIPMELFRLPVSATQLICSLALARLLSTCCLYLWNELAMLIFTGIVRGSRFDGLPSSDLCEPQKQRNTAKDGRGCHTNPSNLRNVCYKDHLLHRYANANMPAICKGYCDDITYEK